MVGGQSALHGHDPLHSFQEIGGDLGDAMDGVHGHVPAHQFGNGENVVIPE